MPKRAKDSDLSKCNRSQYHRHHHHHHNHRQHEYYNQEISSKLIRSVTYLSVVVAVSVSAIKFHLWLKLSSSALLASFTDSILDISSSTINLIAIRLSMRPADDNHRFGHNKFQDLVVFSQAIFFFLSGAASLFQACKSLFLNQRLEQYNQDSAYQMLFCTAITLCLVIYQSYVINRTNSNIVKTERFHYLADGATDIGVIFSVSFSQFAWFLDAACAILISVYIIIGAFKLAKLALKNLLDEEFSSEERDKVVDMIKQHPQALGVHELKTRYAGQKPFIQCHIEMDGELSLTQAHVIAEQITCNIQSAFPGAEIIVHQDPAGIDEQEQGYYESWERS
ncbi:Cation transporter [Rickettsiales endosymbiont of Paramecium tredecaurelia]|nr:cation diffusion facilitator family transporter [Candidatus Sarmatiella mevalonica]MBL3285263.1 Cation transporter [Candidatus Sarmatiella mevalonica]